MKKIIAIVLLGIVLSSVTSRAEDLYTNGIVTGSDGGWSFTGPDYGAASSFVLEHDSIISGFTFGMVANVGSTLQSLNWSITAQPFDGIALFSGLQVAPSSGTYLNTTDSGWGPFWDTYSYTFSLVPFTLSAGTYFLQLDGGTASDLRQVNWENNYSTDHTSLSYQVGGFWYPYVWTNGIRPLAPDSFTFSIQGTSVSNQGSIPEPSTYALFGLGALGLVIALRRRRA